MKKSELTQKRILEAAEQLFLENPIDKVSVMNIAKQAGVAKGTVYLYYETKEEIVWMVIEQYLVRFTEILGSFEIGEVSFESSDLLIDVLFDFINSHFKEMYMLHQVSLQNYLGTEIIENKYIKILTDPLRTWLERGVELGLFTISNLPFYVEFIHASFHGLIDQYIAGTTEFSDATIRFELKQIIRKLLG